MRQITLEATGEPFQIMLMLKRGISAAQAEKSIFCFIADEIDFSFVRGGNLASLLSANI